jgi:hypothetical protein
MLKQANNWLSEDWALLGDVASKTRLNMNAANLRLEPAAHDEAVILLYTLYFIVMGVPVFFKCDLEVVRTFRQKLAYNLLKGNLPM